MCDGRNDFGSANAHPLETKQQNYPTWGSQQWECHEPWLALGNFGQLWLLKASTLSALEPLGSGVAQFSSPSITACNPLKYSFRLLFITAVQYPRHNHDLERLYPVTVIALGLSRKLALGWKLVSIYSP